MNKDKNAKESIEILQDLNLIFEHLNQNDGKYLCFLKTTLEKKDENISNIGYIAINNIVATEILEIYKVFMQFIKKIISDNNCNCKDCQKAIIELKKIINKGEL